MALVEDVVRFARSPMLQELGLPLMRRRDVEVIYANGDNLTATDNPPYIMIWQVADAFRIRRPGWCRSHAVPATAGAPSWAGASRAAGATPRRIRRR